MAPRSHPARWSARAELLDRAVAARGSETAATPGASSSRPSRPARLPLVAAGAALAVNLPLLGVPSLWQDEAATASAARRSPAQLWSLLHHTDVVHGAYYAVLHLWFLLGDSAWWVRLPSALAFAATAGFTTAIAAELAGRRGAITAAVAVLVLPGVAWTAVDARPTAFATLAVTAALWQLLRARPRPLASAICLLVAAIFQVTALFHLPAWVLAAWRPAGWRRTLLAAGAVVLVSAPLLVAAHAQSGQISWIGHADGAVLRSVLVTQPVDGAHSGLLGAAGTPIERGLGLALLLIALVFAVVVRDARLLLWAYGAGAGALLANAVGVHVYLARYFASSTPAFAIMAAMLVARLPRRRWAVGAAGAVAAVLLAAAVPLWIAQRTATGHWSEDLRADAAFVHATPGALVVYVDPSGRAMAEAYPGSVAGHPQYPGAGAERADGTLWGPQISTAQVIAAARGHRAVLLLGTRTSHRIPHAITALGRADGCTRTGGEREHRLQVVLLACR